MGEKSIIKMARDCFIVLCKEPGKERRKERRKSGKFLISALKWSIDIFLPTEHWLSIEVLQVRSNATFLSESYHSAGTFLLAEQVGVVLRIFLWFMGKILVGSIDCSINSWEQNCFSTNRENLKAFSFPQQNTERLHWKYPIHVSSLPIHVHTWSWSHSEEG